MSLTAPPGRPLVFTEERKQLALAEFRRSGRRVAAAKAAGVSAKTIDRHRAEDPDFGEAWETARTEFVEDLEEKARLLAIGELVVERYFSSDGTLVREVLGKPNAAVMIALLKANAREKYGDQFKGQISTTGTIDHKHRLDPTTLDPSQIRAMRQLLGPGPVIEVEIGAADDDEGGSE